MDYETLENIRIKIPASLNSLKTPRAVFSKSSYHFATPSEVTDRHQPIAAISAAYPISWADEGAIFQPGWEMSSEAAFNTL
jgi:alpha-amylase